MSYYNIKTLAHVNVAGAAYNIHISMNIDTGAIHIFKYDQNQCDYGVFWNGDDACDYINLGLASGHWGFRSDSDSE
jgi:hypothetical protein